MDEIASQVEVRHTQENHLSLRGSFVRALCSQTCPAITALPVFSPFNTHHTFQVQSRLVITPRGTSFTFFPDRYFPLLQVFVRYTPSLESPLCTQRHSNRRLSTTSKATKQMLLTTRLCYLPSGAFGHS
jgi:hypothetical protein